MKSILNNIMGMFLLVVVTLSHAGTYDGSYYTDQQRATMVQDYANQLYSSGAVGSIESITKYQDTRLLNGKKGYIGSINVVRPDNYINSTNSSSTAFRSSKEYIVHVFDRSVVGSYNVADGGADCRSFTSPTRTACWGDSAKKNIGIITHIEVKRENPFNSGVSISTQYSQEQQNSSVYYNAYRTTGTTTRTIVQSASVAIFANGTTEMGLIYNALQNADGTFPTKEVLTPPMEIVIVDPVPPVVIIDNSCSAANKVNNKQLDSNICLSLNVLSGCRLIQDIYAADFGIISAGNIAESVANITLICSTGQTFKIKPAFDHKDVAKTHETYQATMWVDTGKNVRLLSNGGINGVGTGQVQTMPIYMKITGKGKDFGRGNVIIEATQFTESYPIELAY